MYRLILILSLTFSLIADAKEVVLPDLEASQPTSRQIDRYVKRFRKLTRSLREGDFVTFANGDRFRLGKFLGRGGGTYVFALNDRQVLRIGIPYHEPKLGFYEFRPKRKDLIDQFYRDQVIFRDAGVRVPRVDRYVPEEYLVVERLNFARNPKGAEITLEYVNHLIQHDPKHPQLESYKQSFREFFKKTWMFHSPGEVKLEHLGLLESGEVVFFDPGGPSPPEKISIKSNSTFLDLIFPTEENVASSFPVLERKFAEELEDLILAHRGANLREILTQPHPPKKLVGAAIQVSQRFPNLFEDSPKILKEIKDFYQTEKLSHSERLITLRALYQLKDSKDYVHPLLLQLFRENLKQDLHAKELIPYIFETIIHRVSPNENQSKEFLNAVLDHYNERGSYTSEAEKAIQKLYLSDSEFFEKRINKFKDPKMTLDQKKREIEWMSDAFQNDQRTFDVFFHVIEEEDNLVLRNLAKDGISRMAKTPEMNTTFEKRWLQKATSSSLSPLELTELLSERGLTQEQSLALVQRLPENRQQELILELKPMNLRNYQRCLIEKLEPILQGVL